MDKSHNRLSDDSASPSATQADQLGLADLDRLHQQFAEQDVEIEFKNPSGEVVLTLSFEACVLLTLLESMGGRDSLVTCVARAYDEAVAGLLGKAKKDEEQAQRGEVA